MDHAAPHGDRDGVDPLDHADVDEGHDAAGGQRQVDRTAGVDVGRAQIGPALVDGDVVALARQIGGEQRRRPDRPRPPRNRRSRHDLVAHDRVATGHATTSSRMSTNRSMSSNEL